MASKSLVMVQVPCPICKKSYAEHFLTRRDLNLELDGEFTLVKCNCCGMVYENPRPASESWELLYPDSYDQYYESTSHTPVKSLETSYGFEKRLDYIRKFQKAGNLLDVGCATGDFLTHANKDPLWTCYGVEPASYAASLASKKGLNIENTAFSQDTFRGVTFDVITLWNVLEHLDDPLGTFELAWEKLSDGGVIVFTTPQLESWDYRIFGKYWIGFELPRHFTVFDRKSINDLLKLTHFQELDQTCLYGSFAQVMSSMRFFLRDKHPSLVKAFEKVFFNLPFHLLLSPYLFISDRAKRSSLITVVAKKVPRE